MPHKTPEARRAYYESRREVRANYMREWHAAHPRTETQKAERRAKERAAREADPELRRRERANYQRWRERHSTEMSARSMTYYYANHDRIKAYRRVWAAENTVYLGGRVQVAITSLPPELQEVALLLKQARQLIRSSQSGG